MELAQHHDVNDFLRITVELEPTVQVKIKICCRGQV